MPSATTDDLHRMTLLTTSDAQTQLQANAVVSYGAHLVQAAAQMKDMLLVQQADVAVIVNCRIV